MWKERREQRALQHVAKKWLMDECLGVAICQAELTISKVCTSLVEEILETVFRVGEARENLRKQKRIERIAMGIRKRDDLLEELARRKRRDLAALRSLEARMGAWEPPGRDLWSGTIGKDRQRGEERSVAVIGRTAFAKNVRRTVNL